jgi:hypothetical protein
VHGTTLDITGGGLIKGDKFTIEAGSCRIKMEGGTLELYGPAVNLHADGELKLNGAPIKLN